MTTPSLEERVKMLEEEVARLRNKVDGAPATGNGTPRSTAGAGDAAAVPVHVAPDAAARVVELSREGEFEAMLQHTRQAVAGLRAIEVGLYDDPDEPGQPRVIITAVKGAPAGPEDMTWEEWGHWFVRTFPPGVCRWFGFDVEYR